MSTRDGKARAAKLELAQCDREEGITLEPFAIADGVDGIETLAGPLMLTDRDGAVELDHRRGPQGQQRVIKLDDLAPVGVLGRGCDRVKPGDSRLDVELTQLLTGCGEVEELLSLGDEVRIPLGAILITQQREGAGLVDARWKPCRMQTHECDQRVASWRCRELVIQKNCTQANGFATQLGAHDQMRG